MAIMSNTDVKKVKVTPAPLQSIPDILPKNKRIESEVTMELNPSEIKRCMSFGTVKEVGEKEVALDPTNFNNKPETKEENPSAPKEDKDPQDSKDTDSNNEQKADSKDE